MRKLGTRFSWVIVGIALTLGSMPSAFADDTELFFTEYVAEETEANPNILFVIDTSGSMSENVLTQEAWDPDRIWSGPYDSNRIYWSEWGGPPSSSSSQYINKTANHCSSSLDDLRAIGAYNDNLAAWKEDSSGGGGWCPVWAWWSCDGGGTEFAWLELNSSFHDRPLECQADDGDHGEGVNGAEVDPGSPWTTDGTTNGPWSTTQNFTWNDQYTLYDANYLNWQQQPGTIIGTRLQVVQDVFSNLMDNLNGVNVGVMRFSTNTEGGPVLHAMAPISVARETLKASVNAMSPSSYTPLSETFYEAGQYIAGRAVDFGNCSGGGCITSTPDSRTGWTYDSPTKFSCQKTHVVLLTDGGPTRDDDANDKIANLPEFASTVGQSACQGEWVSPDPNSTRYDGICLDEMADYLANYDHSDLNGDQTVTTHAIGFTIDLPILEETAKKGGGSYQLADDTASLTVSLQQIILNIFEESTSFTAPAIPVNSFNRTQNLDEVYVSVFEASSRMHWPGNLKKYKLVNGVVTGQDGQPVVDPATGFFSANPPAHSYWSDVPDGDDAKDGGAAHALPQWAVRKVYTNLTGAQDIDLNDAANHLAVATSDTVLTAELLGITSGGSPGTRELVIDWARGKDVKDEDDDGATDDDRNVMGDPLHVAPVTVLYGGTFDDPDAVVFTATNDGYLHAINSRDGTEEWAFIPVNLLPRLFGLYLNNTVSSKQYGLDGDLHAFVINDDFLPGIDQNAGEKAMLIVTMRRGGKSIYALDVTDRDDPQLAWIINPATDAAFADLGQTWSKPTIHKVNFNNEDLTVAIFGGGYDESQDSVGYSEDAVGMAVYMVDVETGERVWSAGVGSEHDLRLDFKHSIPAAVKALDLTGDRYVNRMYVGDMGGRIWRFDVNNGATAADELVSGGVLATLGGADLGNPTDADTRRFYSSPDVVAVIQENHPSYLSINIGSGHRAHPLDTVTNEWFFSVRDYNVFNALPSDDPAYDDPVVFGDLVDITNDTSPILPASVVGWKLAMEVSPGEKILSESTTFKGVTFFVSYSPTPPSNSCTDAIHGGGLNRLYRISVQDGSPALAMNDDQYDENNEPPKTLRYEELSQGGIAPGPVLFFTEHDDDDGKTTDPDLCIGVSCESAGIGDVFTATFWLQDETQ